LLDLTKPTFRGRPSRLALNLHDASEVNHPVIIGPIFSRELVTTPRRPQLFVYRTVYVTAIFVLMCTAWLVLAGTQLVRNIGDMARFGAILFQILAPLQLALLTFLSALTAASGVAQEKDRRTLLLLLMTRLNNQELVLGKLLASLLEVLVMLAAALPVFMLLTLFGGVSADQVIRAFAVTLATVLAAGSLGSTVALAREKTFQSLSMTALILVLWIGAWEAAAVLGQERSIGGLSIPTIATAASPLRAILVAVNPYRQTVTYGLSGEWLFVITAITLSVVLNAWAILWLRVWNPGREVRATRPTEEEDVGPAAAAATPTDGTSSRLEAARAGHVDARVRKVEAKSRQVWDNPILWREVCTWAYGKKVIVIRVVYLLLALLSLAGLYQSIESGEAIRRAAEGTILPVAATPLVPFMLASLVIVNALAVTSITTERDGGALDLLLVTDLTPREFVFGKIGGVAWITKEMIALPILMCAYLWIAGGLTLENFLYLLIGLSVLNLFVIVLGIHSGMIYSASRTAIGVSLGSVFFLFLGVATLILMMISFSGAFQTQLPPFLAFIVGGSVGLFVTLGHRNPSGAIGLASLGLPIATFFAVTSFLLDKWFNVFLVTTVTYGFTSAAILIPAIYEFDIAMGRTKTAGEE
jgi:ABC-type transport system involved in multi-copper enzyme maturation permease subunit